MAYPAAMRGLLLRLSDLDPDAGAFVRVIDYFDQLVRNGASLEALTRASAALGCCTAGLRDEETGRVVRFDGAGQSSPPVEHPVVIEKPVVIEESVVGYVWLERAMVQRLDEILIERMAVTAAARWRPFDRADGADPALIELVIGMSTEEEDRIRALRLLGLSPTRPLRAVAVSVSSGDLAPVMRATACAVSDATGIARATVLGMSGAILVQAQCDITDVLRALPESGMPGVCIGIGCRMPAAQAAASWSSARVAARFARAWRHKGVVVNHDELGSLATLADVPRDMAMGNPDVRALAKLASIEGGEEDIDVLLAVTWHGSARQAAGELHMHHSSVTNRLRHVENALGVSIADPTGRLRAQVAAILWRMASFRVTLGGPE